MRVLTVAALVCLSLTSARADEFDVVRSQREPWPTGWAVAGEVGAGAAVGIAGLYVGAAGGYFTSLQFLHPGSNMDEPYHAEAAIIGAICVGYPLGFATGTWALGSIGRQGGRYWGALLGAAAGAGVTLATYYMFPAPVDVPTKGIVPGIVIASMIVGPPTGAILGYNLTRPRNTEVGWLEQHLDVPRMAMTMSHDEFNQPVAGVRCDLLTARF